MPLAIQAWQTGGTVLAIAGLVALYLSWRLRKRSWPLVVGGWGLVLAAIVAWGQTSGVDKGPALGIVVVVMMALLGVAVVAMRTPVKQRRTIEPRVVPQDSQQPGGKGLAPVASLLAIVALGLLTSVAAATAIFTGSRSLGVEHTANLTMTMFAFPILWAAFAFYIVYSQSVAKRAVVALGTIAVSAAIIAIASAGG